MSVWSVWLFQRCCLSSSRGSGSGTGTGSGKQLARSCHLLAHPDSHFSCLGGGSHMPSPCTTGLNHHISPFLTASNGVHPPTRVLSTCPVPPQPQTINRPRPIQSNRSPTLAPTHSLTNLSHPHTRLKQAHYSLTRPLTHCIASAPLPGTPAYAPPPRPSSYLTSVSVSASAARPPGSDLPANLVRQRMSTAADHGHWH